MEKEESGGHGVVIALLALFFIYVFCPFVIIVPLIALEKSGMVSKGSLDKVGVIFLPLEYLCNKVPPYQQLIEAESKLARKLVGDPV